MECWMSLITEHNWDCNDVMPLQSTDGAAALIPVYQQGSLLLRDVGPQASNHFWYRVKKSLNASESFMCSSVLEFLEHCRNISGAMVKCCWIFIETLQERWKTLAGTMLECCSNVAGPLLKDCWDNAVTFAECCWGIAGKFMERWCVFARMLVWVCWNVGVTLLERWCNSAGTFA